MRKAMLLLAVLVLVGSLWAADPMLGTWELNIAQSTFTQAQPAPKEETAIWRAIGKDKNLSQPLLLPMGQLFQQRQQCLQSEELLQWSDLRPQRGNQVSLQ